ncbi:hypothetical protein OO256_05315 [Pseudomonas sp. DCB_CB]|uniref:hypothetical protein n=1 Tax=unclassified Pseudomonas TaxID=196821 RepID=UPI002248F835|nr:MULTISPECIES: hypothetical protein [unclassified Pseudomonas]MCX2689899.1 hypothetical protein [Pseudomonas sp. DCB_BZ]MCX2855522.1 hypothetical protein [Pseudomonas sp. DCB_CB]
MQSPDRITLVVRPADGHTLEEIKSYVRLEAYVQLGNGLAVIAGASEGDLQWQLEKALARAGGAPQMVAVYTPWTDAQVLDFLSVALRHVVVEGDLQFSDINDALRYMAEKGQPAFCKAFGIDEHVKLVADARRYRWLRDEALSTGSGFTPAVYDRAGGIGTVRVGEDLDQRIDSAIRHLTKQQVTQDTQEQQP